MRLIAYLRGLARRRAIDAEAEDELRFHLEQEIEANLARGMSAPDARRVALRDLRGLTHTQQAVREVRATWLDAVCYDTRLAGRSLRRSPVFTSVALLTLALGIGANTAILSIVNGVLLRPLAYPHPEQLMYLDAPGPAAPGSPVSVPEYLDFQRFNQSFAAVGAFRTGETNLTAGDRALRIRSAIVDAHLLTALGVQPAQGRLFAANETGVPAPPPVAVISYELWHSAFGGRPIAGERVDLGGRRVQIVGVMARGADLMDTHAEIWLPLGFLPGELRARNNHNVHLIGRLKEGVTATAAQTELKSLIETWATRASSTPGPGHAGHVFLPPGAGGQGHVLRMTPLADQILGRANRSIWVLQAAVGLVLLIACANVANLLLARAEARQREFALQTALGASSARLLRKVMTESVMLAVAGCAIGVLVARVSLQFLVRVYPASLPRIGEVAVDPQVMLVSLAIALACGVLSGLAPIMRTRSDVMSEVLKSGPRGFSGTSRHRVRRALVMAETALAVLVTVGAGLLLQTVHNLMTVDAGFDRARLITFSITPPLENTNIRTLLVGVASADRTRTYQRVVEQLRALPGIQGASAMTALPLERSFLGNQTEVANHTAIAIDYQRVMSGFFDTMRIPIVQGRGFESTDATSSGWVTVINETLANTQWKGLNPIGQRFRPAGDRGNNWFTVVGVAKDVKQTGVDHQVGPEAYVFAEQFVTDSPPTWVAFSPATMHVVVRSTLPLATVAPMITRVVRDVDPTLPAARLREMEDVFAQSMQRPRLLAQLFAAFAVLAVLLAMIGTYGVLAYTVAERRREIGIRLALGATRARLLGQVMKYGLVPTAIGVAAGVAGALGLNRLVASLLFGVRPTDPGTLSAVILTVSLIAVVACWLPAWRASQLDPNVVLRED